MSSWRTSAAVVLIALLAGFQEVKAHSAPKKGAGPDLRLEGPFENRNLAIYVVRGPSPADNRSYVTLDEALRAGTAVLRERGAASGQDHAQVNELEIENKSDRWLFLQAGDVISGGKQDRTIAIDVALAPRSAPQPISAFCVEHGRWTAKSGSGLAFQGNTAIVGSGGLKRKIQGEKSQSGVWDEVAAGSAKASVLVTGAAGRPASALSSTGTFNAIVENREIRSQRADYVNSLLPRLEQSRDAIGLVVAVNGEIIAADIYGSRALFHQLARKLVESYALEALLARNEAKAAAKPPGKDAALAFLADVSVASGKDESVTPEIHRTTRETAKVVLYEYTDAARDSAGAGLLLHKNFVKK
jgi:hypothetical protein